MTAGWWEPGACEVVPGVHRVPLPLPLDGLRAVNVYVIEETDGLCLIDGGWALEISERELTIALKSIGYGLGDIRRFLVTHVHRDHFTQAVVLRDRLGAQVGLGAGERESLVLIREQEPGRPQLRGLERAGAEPLLAAWREWMRNEVRDLSIWSDPDVWLEDRETVVVGERELEVIATPGHTQGHVVFADARHGVLFAGDHVLPHITPSVGFEPVAADLPLGDYLRSLAKVRRLPDLQLLPAHGSTGGSLHERVDELLEHHRQRLSLCAGLLNLRGRTAYEIAADMPWTSRSRSLAELDAFNSTLAVLEAAAHLDVLVARGEASSRIDGNIIYYSSIPQER
ncbi:MBL fold metallo-hydrolase [Kribbella sp. NPDC051137]|uniref:MBL fold metallo-hydrolase n=1 Tax=Kribbella sp. NPDC051137 TaxID=3155045 RepID=UPI003415B376